MDVTRRLIDPDDYTPDLSEQARVDAPEPDALPYQPLNPMAPPAEAAPRPRVRPIPDERLATWLSVAAAIGLPNLPAAARHIERSVKPEIVEGKLGEALAEMGIGRIPAGLGSEAPAWLRASSVLLSAGFAAYTARGTYQAPAHEGEAPASSPEPDGGTPRAETQHVDDLGSPGL